MCRPGALVSVGCPAVISPSAHLLRRLPSQDSVEWRLHGPLNPVWRDASALGRIAIVDPGSNQEVDCCEPSPSRAEERGFQQNR
jgi:hypothetical protein